eukprot:5230153-Amphidinium_carterae.1
MWALYLCVWAASYRPGVEQRLLRAGTRSSQRQNIPLFLFLITNSAVLLVHGMPSIDGKTAQGTS